MQPLLREVPAATLSMSMPSCKGRFPVNSRSTVGQVNGAVLAVELRQVEKHREDLGHMAKILSGYW